MFHNLVLSMNSLMSYPKQANKHTHTSTLLYTTCYHSHTTSHISCMHHMAYSHPTYNMCCIHTYSSHPITTYSQHTLHHIHSKYSHISFITFITFIHFISHLIHCIHYLNMCDHVNMFLMHHQNTICSNAWLYSYAVHVHSSIKDMLSTFLSIHKT